MDNWYFFYDNRGIDSKDLEDLSLNLEHLGYKYHQPTGLGAGPSPEQIVLWIHNNQFLSDVSVSILSSYFYDVLKSIYSWFKLHKFSNKTIPMMEVFITFKDTIDNHTSAKLRFRIDQNLSKEALEKSIQVQMELSHPSDSMQIKILSDDELTQEDRKQIHNLDLICFGQKAVDEEPIYYFAPTFKHVLLFKDQRLVSYLRTVLREAQWAGNKILIGGIGSVETDPEYQGKGLAGIILKEAMKLLKEQHVDFGLLQTNIDKGAKLYGKVEFIPANRPYEVLDVNNNKRMVKAKDVMIAPIQNSQLVEDIMRSDEVLFIGKGDW